MVLKACVILPPSNIELAVVRTQERLFSQAGLASSQALPVLMPLSWHDAAVSASDFRLALGRRVQAFPMRAAGFRRHRNALYLMLEWDESAEGHWYALKRRLGALPAFNGTPPFPPAKGLFLADHERESAALDQALGDPPATPAPTPTSSPPRESAATKPALPPNRP